MKFIEYPLPAMGEKPDSSEILRTRRTELNLTQQQVAEGAHIQLQQYQRLELGERKIENASMRIALSICAVLKLDPFVLFPECISMNTYSDSAVRSEQFTMNASTVMPIFESVCNLFNDKFGTSRSEERRVGKEC